MQATRVNLALPGELVAGPGRSVVGPRLARGGLPINPLGDRSRLAAGPAHERVRQYGNLTWRVIMGAWHARHDVAALDEHPLTKLPGVQRRTKSQYPATSYAAGLALRDVLQETVMAVRLELAPRAGESLREHDWRAGFEALLRGRSMSAAARELGIRANAHRSRNLYGGRDLFVRRFLELSGAMSTPLQHTPPQQTPHREAS